MGELRDRVSNGEFERVCESPNLGSGQPARPPADPDRPTDLRNCPRGGGVRPSVGALPPPSCWLCMSSPSSRLRRPPSRGHTSQHPVERRESRTMLSLLLPLASGLALNHAAFSRAGNNLDVRSHAPLMQHGGKGFGGGEATRDPCVFAHQTMENAHQHHLFFRTHRLFACALHLKSQSADRLRS